MHARRAPRRRRHRLAAAVALLVLGIVAPSHGEDEARGPHVILRDFRIDAPARPIHAGTIDLVLDNRGPTVHELVLARTTLDADDLPIGKDGLSVSETSARVRIVDEIEEVQLGDTAVLHVRLEPGHYVLFCNLEGHYLGGMHADLEVVP